MPMTITTKNLGKNFSAIIATDGGSDATPIKITIGSSTEAQIELVLDKKLAFELYRPLRAALVKRFPADFKA